MLALVRLCYLLQPAWPGPAPIKTLFSNATVPHIEDVAKSKLLSIFWGSPTRQVLVLLKGPSVERELTEKRVIKYRVRKT
ncbi:hypothetical protein FPV67DRAFT_1207155 [Lyophyllum atratum]|nr:hypothetical protein FPV67DRAFT_1207155 [Lyophyllum atratum]